MKGMPRPSGDWISGRAGLLLQAALLVAVPIVAFAPPAEGSMLVAPVLPDDTATTARWASRHGARLLGPGTLPGSYLVYARRADLLAPALAGGMLIVRADYQGCTTIEGR